MDARMQVLGLTCDEAIVCFRGVALSTKHTPDVQRMRVGWREREEIVAGQPVGNPALYQQGD
jgi:hypothetical protein